MDTSTGAAARSGGRAAGRRDPAFAPDFYRRACAACALLLLALCAATAVGLCDAISGAPKPAARTGPARPPRRLRAVVGADDRQRIVDPAVPPYSSIVQLSMATAAGNASCSGVLLSRDLVLTAASCVYLPLGSVRGITKPSWVYGIRVTPMEKRRAAKPIGVASLHVPTRYFSAVSSVGNTNDAAEADFALLRLSQAVIPTPPLLNRSGTLPYAGGGIALGFPSNKPGLWSSRCQIRISGTNLTQWISCDVGDGQEGGPILRDRLPAVAGSTPPLLVGVAARTPAGSPLNRMTVLGADAESFIRKVLLLPADPCMSGGRTCNTNALCTTNGTRALCACRPGLFGDGYTCASDLCLARGLKCGANGYCLDTGDIPRCRCNAGFIGDGVTCVLPTSTKTATRTRTKTPTRTATRTASRTATRTKAATSTSSRPASTRAASSTATSAMIFVASSSTIQAIDAASTTSRLLANTLPGSSTNGVSSTLTGTTTSLIDVTSTSTASATTTSVFPNPCVRRHVSLKCSIC